MASRLASRRGGSHRAGPLKPIAQPTVKLEEALYDLGRRIIVGVDEVGRGSIAGPVVAAACRIPPDLLSSASLSEVRDSKQLDDVSRRRIARQILSGCDVAYGAMPPELIDRIGIAPATRLAMAAAVDQVSPEPRLRHSRLSAVELWALAYDGYCERGHHLPVDRGGIDSGQSLSRRPNDRGIVAMAGLPLGIEQGLCDQTAPGRDC